jgi:hypothetical protein
MITTSPVRKARPEDRPEVLRICEQDHAENGQFSLSPPKLEATVSRILDGHGGIIGLIERGRGVEAIIKMQISQFWYTEDWCLEETLNYVRPEFRRSTNAKDMIAFAKRCSDELAIPLVIGVVSNERTAAKIALYERQLGPAVGGYFIYSKRPLSRTMAPIAERAATG